MYMIEVNGPKGLQSKEMADAYGEGLKLKDKKGSKIRNYDGKPVRIEWDLGDGMIRLTIGSESTIISGSELQYLLRNV